VEDSSGPRKQAVATIARKRAYLERVGALLARSRFELAKTLGEDSRTKVRNVAQLAAKGGIIAGRATVNNYSGVTSNVFNDT
jgi:hypothetical protein